MFGKITLSDWEQLVKKQLKTDDIYAILTKENLEGLSVKPYYDGISDKLRNLPKVEKSTHLVSRFSESADENVFAFIMNKPSGDLVDKTIFVAQDFVENDFKFSPENRYFSLIECFNDLGYNDGNFEYILDEKFAERLLAMPFERAICVDVSTHQNAGAAIYQQLGIMLAKTKELVEVFGSDILKKIIIRLAVGPNYFFEMAKIRAVKLVYNQLSKEFGLDEIPYIFAETSFRNKAKNDEENNLIRSTLELAAAMIGGADAVYANDFKLENSNELSEEISFKQQIVLAYESIINVFEDAANGSAYVEDLTQQIAEKSWAYFIEIEENGGYLENLKSGKIQKEIYNHAVEEQKWVEQGKIKLIGVNLYPKLNAKKTAEEMYSDQEIKPVRWAEMFE